MNGWSWRGWRQRCVGGVAWPIKVSVKVYEMQGGDGGGGTLM